MPEKKPTAPKEDTVLVSFRFPISLKEELKATASEERYTMTEAAVWFLRRGLQRHKAAKARKRGAKKTHR